MINSETEHSPEQEKTVEEAALLVVNSFDSANTGDAIERMGPQGFIVSRAIDSLREALNKDEQKTILDQTQVDQCREDLKRIYK